MSRVESYHFSLGLNNHLPVPTGSCWILGLAFKACGELPAPCSPPGLLQTLPQTSPLLTPKDCFTAPALPLRPISLLLVSFSPCILDSDSGSPFKAEFLRCRLRLSATLAPQAFIVVQLYSLLSSLLSLFGLPPGG